jgi:hypothetical protein
MGESRLMVYLVEQNDLDGMGDSLDTHAPLHRYSKQQGIIENID